MRSTTCRCGLAAQPVTTEPSPTGSLHAMGMWQAARRHYSQGNGCAWCAPACHTGRSSWLSTGRAAARGDRARGALCRYSGRRGTTRVFAGSVSTAERMNCSARVRRGAAGSSRPRGRPAPPATGAPPRPNNRRAGHQLRAWLSAGEDLDRRGAGAGVRGSGGPRPSGGLLS